ncbi:hypothetical protein Q8W71_31110 [Methylobacterium sp. NEAU 140]|uniref:hypothetical protein n=1 Tax=Methylobacterium sp. NEAU 140 TaxID=3064945 RepID=UPI0027333C5A|nr:hypothetical protein [Methylobacterium sp. NEAU 140]MDP4027041.1 hypothetical protein [Methylobacterium sp. NEAU 140]
MATELGLAHRYAHSLAQTLMVPVTVFHSEAGYAVVTPDEYEGDPAGVVTEFDPHEG